MFASIIYDFNLFLMIFLLYRYGKVLKIRYKLLSSAGLVLILAYVLNVGMRFGRGIDYNVYGREYELLEKGYDVRWDFFFQQIAKVLIFFEIPYQGFIMLLSLIFILGTLSLMKSYKVVMPLALPLFVLFSNSAVENMIRWFLAFSIFMFGLPTLIERKRINSKFIFFSIIACLIHFAFIPIPLVFCLIAYMKNPMFNPIVAILLFVGIILFFDTDFMLSFEELIQVLSSTSENFEKYGKNAEYWLTGGYGGNDPQQIKMSDVLFLCSLCLLGYNTAKQNGKSSIFAYNIFLIGMMLYPISLKIELVNRFMHCFYFFRAIVLAYVCYGIFVTKEVKYSFIIILFPLLIFANYGRRYFSEAFVYNPNLYLYVWNKGNCTYDKCENYWHSKDTE